MDDRLHSLGVEGQETRVEEGAIANRKFKISDLKVRRWAGEKVGGEGHAAPLELVTEGVAGTTNMSRLRRLGADGTTGEGRGAHSKSEISDLKKGKKKEAVEGLAARV